MNGNTSTCQIINHTLPPNEYGCVYAWTTNHIFRWSSFWSWRICKQAKLSHLGHRKPARIYWNADAPKGEAVTVNGDRYQAMLNEFLFTKIEDEDISNIWFQQDGATWHTAEATLDVLRPVFKDRIISRRADVVWPPRSWDLTPLDYYLWGAVKDRCYADKPETIDALKDNIREAIGEIQLHTIDNVFKNWSDRVGYCMASRVI